MELKEITNKEEWENFLLQCSEKTFLQSWNWGEFNQKMGSKIWRFGAYNNERLFGVCLVVKVIAKRGTFLYIPHGPVVSGGLKTKDEKEILELILIRLLDIAKEEGANFIRVSPISLEREENKNIFVDLGFRNSPMPASAYEATWKLEVFPQEEEILKNMRKTTRYLIKNQRLPGHDTAFGFLEVNTPFTFTFIEGGFAQSALAADFHIKSAFGCFAR